jgi:hypothetical protein
VVERGKQFAHRQIAGATEDHQVENIYGYEFGHPGILPDPSFYGVSDRVKNI